LGWVHFVIIFSTLGHYLLYIRVAAIASSGVEVHPVLTMDVFDRFSRDATVEGIRLGQPIMISIQMTDAKEVYQTIRPDVCIASDRPELANPETSTAFLLFEG
jgi:hypothetical protein